MGQFWCPTLDRSDADVQPFARSALVRAPREPLYVAGAATTVRGVELRGWNGTLQVGERELTIRRGLRSMLVRRRRDPDLVLRPEQVAAVRFAAATKLPGYLQLVERGAPPAADYMSTIRDTHTVTFTGSGHAEQWREAAETIARRCGVELEISAGPPYWKTIRAESPLRGGNERVL